MKSPDSYTDLLLKERNEYQNALYILYDVACIAGDAHAASFIASVLRITTVGQRPPVDELTEGLPVNGLVKRET